MRFLCVLATSPSGAECIDTFYISAALIHDKEGSYVMQMKHEGETRFCYFCRNIYTLQNKRMYFSSQSKMLYLLQLCLFSHSEGCIRTWQSGFSNKLDSQTKELSLQNAVLYTF